MNGRILVVDDEGALRRMTRLALEAAGHAVGEAADGASALLAYGDGGAWDAVLLDQRMPGLDGLEVLARIRERDRVARVIMVTAYASVELAVEAMKLGALDFVRKPATPAAIRDAVSAALAREAEAPSRRLSPGLGAVEAVTLNGFRIARSESLSSSRPERRVFRVRSGSGEETTAFVDVGPEAVDRVRRLARRDLPVESAFWTSIAERALATYLWNEGHVPDAPLVVADVGVDDIHTAERWELAPR